MGSYATGYVVYGFGWRSEEAPPIWASEYGDFDPDKVNTPQLEDDDVDTDDLYELLEQVAEAFGHGLLDTDAVGYLDGYAGNTIYVKTLAADSGGYGFEPLDMVRLEPTPEEKAAIMRAADYLGVPQSDVGWHVYCTYG